VADYCKLMERGEITVNRSYQRSDKVWPPVAKSFLIETILLAYPIPKLTLYQVTDIKSRETYKEIVDGQQRSQAISDFYNNRLSISKNSGIAEAAGKYYSQLNEELQHQFLDYSLSIDLLVSASQDEIREVFRRINSYTIPLNPEENRHAIYQGAFKWFMYKLSRKYAQTFVNMGVFGEKQLIRMADTKLMSEMVHAINFGITTTNERILNKLYAKYDERFSMEIDIETRFDEIVNYTIQFEDIFNSPLVKPYNFYSLGLAITHMRKPVNNFIENYNPEVPYVFNRDVVKANLTNLADALEALQESGKYKEFVKANLSMTNVAAHRIIRFKWFCKALGADLI